MNEKFDLKFCYKGTRTYVHGTDIYAKLIEYMKISVEKIDLVFHGITHNNMTFSDEQPDQDDVKVVFKYKTDEKTVRLYGVENQDKVECRYEYLEEKIVAHSKISVEEKVIELIENQEYSFIEHIVAMDKALLEKLYKNIEGKWYFTRLQLNENIDIEHVSSLSLRFESNFQFKLTKSKIIVNNLDVGYIYFSLVK